MKIFSPYCGTIAKPEPKRYTYINAISHNRKKASDVEIENLLQREIQNTYVSGMVKSRRHSFFSSILTVRDYNLNFH